MAEGSLEVKLPTMWADEKQSWEESEKVREGQRREEERRGEERRGEERRGEERRGEEKRREEKKREDQRRESLRRKKNQVREKVGKSRNSVFFQWFVAPEGRKVGSLKRRVPSQLARWEIKSCTPLWRRSEFASEKVKNMSRSQDFWKLSCGKSAHRCDAKHMSKSKSTKHTMFGPLLEVVMSKKCTPLWHEAHFEVKIYKTHHVRTTFGSCDVEKVHAVVMRSTFRSQNLQNTPCSDHFWKLWCRKSACRCGTKHILKSKSTKHTILGPLLEVAMSKKCTPLWHEAHFEVKIYKTHHVRTTFGSCDVEKVHAVVMRSTFPSQNLQNTPCSDHFWKLWCRKSVRRCDAKQISK